MKNILSVALMLITFVFTLRSTGTSPDSNTHSVC